mmetsp:Transcript_66342/g.209700  ORF Transcript_66342/g.209700 Transcript_66342/m.209700 type:complete len:214 (+) Transcript_66342:1038-1679(+)
MLEMLENLLADALGVLKNGAQAPSEHEGVAAPLGTLAPHPALPIRAGELPIRVVELRLLFVLDVVWRNDHVLERVVTALEEHCRLMKFAVLTPVPVLHLLPCARLLRPPKPHHHDSVRVRPVSLAHPTVMRHKHHVVAPLVAPEPRGGLLEVLYHAGELRLRATRVARPPIREGGHVEQVGLRRVASPHRAVVQQLLEEQLIRDVDCVVVLLP